MSSSETWSWGDNHQVDTSYKYRHTEGTHGEEQKYRAANRFSLGFIVSRIQLLISTWCVGLDVTLNTLVKIILAIWLDNEEPCIQVLNREFWSVLLILVWDYNRFLFTPIWCKSQKNENQLQDKPYLRQNINLITFIYCPQETSLFFSKVGWAPGLDSICERICWS